MEKKKKTERKIYLSVSLKSTGRAVSLSAHLVCGPFLLFNPRSRQGFGDFDEKNSTGRSPARGAGSAALGALRSALVSAGFVCRANSGRQAACGEGLVHAVLGLRSWRRPGLDWLILARTRHSKPPPHTPFLQAGLLSSDGSKVSPERAAAEVSTGGGSGRGSLALLAPRAFCYTLGSQVYCLTGPMPLPKLVLILI